jgi:hypothetical protein
MGKKSAQYTAQHVVAVVPMGDVLKVLKAIADADAVKADIEQSGADSFDRWIAEQLRPKAATSDPDTAPGHVPTINHEEGHIRLAFPEDESTDAQPALDLNAIRDQAQRNQPRHVIAYMVQGTASDVAEVLRSI